MRVLTKLEGRIVSENVGGGVEDSFMPMENRDEEQIGNDMANAIGTDFMGLDNDDDLDMAPGKCSDLLVHPLKWQTSATTLES